MLIVVIDSYHVCSTLCGRYKSVLLCCLRLLVSISYVGKLKKHNHAGRTMVAVITCTCATVKLHISLSPYMANMAHHMFDCSHKATMHLLACKESAMATMVPTCHLHVACACVAATPTLHFAAVPGYTSHGPEKNICLQVLI